MKRFIVKSLLLVTGVVVIFGGWSALLLWMEVSTYRRTCRPPDGTRIVICGDSQCDQGVLPQLWPGCYNFSTQGLQLDQVELKVIDVLQYADPLPKAIVLDLTPFKLLDQSLDVPLKDTAAVGGHFLLHALHPDRTRRSLDGLPVLFRDHVLVKRTSRLFKALRKGIPYECSVPCPGGVAGLTEAQVEENRRRLLAAPAVCGFTQYPDWIAMSLKKGADDLAAFPPLTADSPSLACWRDIVADIRAKGVEPVVITTPYSRQALDALRPGLKESFRREAGKLAEELGVKYFDYLEMPFETGEWRDVNHLNVRGAVRFTETVRRDIEGYLR